jgi:hypothetical protein
MQFLKYIPGTSSYAKDLKIKIIKKVQKQLYNFEMLSSFNALEKDELFISTKRHIKHVSSIEERHDKLYTFLLFLFFIPVGAFTQIILPFQLSNYFSNYNYQGSSFAWFFTSYLFLFSVLSTFIIILPFIIFESKTYNERKMNIVRSVFIFSTVSACFFFSFENISFEHSGFAKFLLASMLGASIYLGGVSVIVLFILEPFSYFEKARKLNKIPQSRLINNLIIALMDVDKGIFIRKFEDKSILMFYIEMIAKTIEEIPSFIECSDKESNVKVKNAYGEIAYFIRDIKQEIAISGGTTRNHLRFLLKEYFIHISKNNWQKLNRKTLPGHYHEKEVKKQIWFYFKTIIIGIIPLALLKLNVSYNVIKLDAGIIPYLNIITVIWLIMNILFMIDPSLKDKISMIKDIASFQSFKSK